MRCANCDEAPYHTNFIDNRGKNNNNNINESNLFVPYNIEINLHDKFLKSKLEAEYRK